MISVSDQLIAIINQNRKILDSLKQGELTITIHDFRSRRITLKQECVIGTETLVLTNLEQPNISD